MSRYLLLLRHGKAEKDVPDLPDHERPLTRLGRRQARAVGKHLRGLPCLPDLIVASTARRARATARRVARALKSKPLRLLYPELYNAQPEQVVQLLRKVPFSPITLLVVGHNPCWEQLAAHLVRQPVPLPTAGLARIVLPIDDWSELSLDTEGRLLDVWSPPDERGEARARDAAG
ncbi:MAG: phosphoglycerate mutase [Pirellulaceae bacterium]|nr:MAG: phosphoglycerate mutase [Pirellulaceae bacterium]